MLDSVLSRSHMCDMVHVYFCSWQHLPKAPFQQARVHLQLPYLRQALPRGDRDVTADTGDVLARGSESYLPGLKQAFHRLNESAVQDEGVRCHEQYLGETGMFLYLCFA